MNLPTTNVTSASSPSPGSLSSFLSLPTTMNLRLPSISLPFISSPSPSSPSSPPPAPLTISISIYSLFCIFILLLVLFVVFGRRLYRRCTSSSLSSSSSFPFSFLSLRDQVIQKRNKVREREKEKEKAMKKMGIYSNNTNQRRGEPPSYEEANHLIKTNNNNYDNNNGNGNLSDISLSPDTPNPSSSFPTPSPSPSLSPPTHSSSSSSFLSSPHNNRSLLMSDDFRSPPLPSSSLSSSSLPPRSLRYSVSLSSSPTLPPLSSPSSSSPTDGVLYLHLIEMSFPSPSHYFCIISFGVQVFRTSLSSYTKFPFWLQKCRIVVKNTQYKWPLTISVFMKGGGGGGSPILKSKYQWKEISSLLFHCKEGGQWGINGVHNMWIQEGMVDKQMKKYHTNNKNNQIEQNIDGNGNSVMSTIDINSPYPSPSDSDPADNNVSTDIETEIDTDIESQSLLRRIPLSNNNNNKPSVFSSSAAESDKESSSSSLTSSLSSSSSSSSSTSLFSRLGALRRYIPYSSNSLLPSSSSSPSSSLPLHIEVGFLPLLSYEIGRSNWLKIASLYDVTDQKCLTTSQLSQLISCISNLNEHLKRTLMERSEHSAISLEEVVEVFTELEQRSMGVMERNRERERESGRGRGREIRGDPMSVEIQVDGEGNENDNDHHHDNGEEDNHHPNSRKHSSSSSLTLSGHDVYNHGGLFLRRCPVCLIDLLSSLGSLDYRDSILHVKFCLENVESGVEGSTSYGGINHHNNGNTNSNHNSTPMSAPLEQDGEFAQSGFISEELAILDWTPSLIHSAYQQRGTDKGLFDYLQSKSNVILIQDRMTGRLVEEKVPIIFQWIFKLIYQSSVGRLSSSAINFTLFSKLSEVMGRRHDDPSSVSKIPSFVKYYDIDMSQFEGGEENNNESKNNNPNTPPSYLHHYKTFNEFFYRKLKPNVRPISSPHSPHIITSPADCRITVFSTVSEATRIWIKGKKFSLSTLLVHPALLSSWPDCSLAIARLAPDDYHRFHSPIDCTIGMIKEYSGGYASVNPMAIRSGENVLTENKRVLVQLFSPVVGEVLYIAVGATIVGSVVMSVQSGQKVKKGEEIGFFKFGGSTVLLLFKKERVRFDNDLLENSQRAIETKINMGAKMAEVRREGGGKREMDSGLKKGVMVRSNSDLTSGSGGSSSSVSLDSEITLDTSRQKQVATSNIIGL